MKIFVTGTRGIPNIPGGVEKHCQELYPLIVNMGHDVTLAARKPYVTHPLNRWLGVSIENIYAPRKKSVEAILHTFLAIVNARRVGADIVHIHAVGPGLMVPLAKLLGLKVVVTNHGPDYDRQKWGRVARAALRLGEYLGGKFADEVIVISRVIETIILERCNKTSHLIYNGVRLPDPSERTDYIQSIGLSPRNYIIAVSRFVPEKGLDLLVRAFQKTHSDCKLVIAGDADHETDYSRQLKARIDEDEGIVRTGYITGEPLHQLYSHARLFVLPSFHEGLPIALLEAMSYGLSVLVSDIPANLEVGLNPERYFKCGNVPDLQKKMIALLKQPISEMEQMDLQLQILEKYNWLKIAEETVAVYEKALSPRKNPLTEQ